MPHVDYSHNQQAQKGSTKPLSHVNITVVHVSARCASEERAIDTVDEPRTADLALKALAPATAPSRARKLSTGHFAFMRGLVQGLPVRDMWERYLQVEGASGDLRVVRATIHWMRDAFAAAARREDRFGTARLVLIDVSRLPEVAVKLPTLDAFAAARGLEEFSQAEQIEAYEAVYGRASQRQSRRARLVQRQLDALRWLETVSYTHLTLPTKA